MCTCYVCQSFQFEVLLTVVTALYLCICMTAAQYTVLVRPDFACSCSKTSQPICMSSQICQYQGVDVQNLSILTAFEKYAPCDILHRVRKKMEPLFTACRNSRIASDVLATAIQSVCASVRPSHAGIVSKRRHVAWCSLHCWIAKCV